jgi:polyhydroxyalkanoate synthesis repressor PhaR
VSETSNAGGRSKKPDGPVIIKKYANRRLYNTQTSNYVTLDHLCEMVKNGTEFEVRDARTGEDITRSVLTQIIVEEESKGQHMLPIQFLRQLIRFYGDSLQAFLPGYLEASMESFSKNQDTMRTNFTNAFGGISPQDLEKLTRNNLQIFERAMRMFMPFGAGMGAPPAEAKAEAPAPKSEPAPETRAHDQEIRDLKEQIEAMRRQVAELATRKTES